jgi:flagellar biosynthetic protein FliR
LLVALARVGPFVWLGLPFGGRWLRAIVALLLALPVAASLSVAGTVPLLVREAIAGSTLGLVASVPVRAFEAAGALVDRARSPHARTFEGAFLLLALALFAAAGGPALWVSALAESYRALPVGGAAIEPAGATMVIEAAGRLVVAAVAWSAPLLAALLAADVLVGLVARAAPSLAPTGAARPARELALLVALAASSTALAAALGGGIARTAEELARAARALAG